jgi:hypothetical protein
MQWVKSDRGSFPDKTILNLLYFDITSDYITYYLFHVYLYPFSDQLTNLLQSYRVYCLSTCYHRDTIESTMWLCLRI